MTKDEAKAEYVKKAVRKMFRPHRKWGGGRNPPNRATAV